VRLLRRKDTAISDEFPGDLDALLAEVDELTRRNRVHRDLETERRLLSLRHMAGVRLIDDAEDGATFAEPDFERLPPRRGSPGSVELPEVAPAELTAGLIRAGVLRDGCLRVRGLIGRDDALALAAEIERAFTERQRRDDGDSAAVGYYEEFTPQSRFGDDHGREWVKQGGGVLAVDAPTVAFRLGELFTQAGVVELVTTYLGEPAIVSMHKTTLRRAMPAVVRDAWHQDGFFMGDVRSLNLWVALSRCGDLAPGMDFVPKRFESYVLTNTDGAPLDYTISEQKAADAAGEIGFVRPIFEPGDAIFFDELCIHSTAAEPTMPNPRYAVENWFFGSSGFPRKYAPLTA